MYLLSMLLATSAGPFTCLTASIAHGHDLDNCDPDTEVESHTFEGNEACTVWSSHQINSLRPVNLGVGCKLDIWQDQIRQEKINDYYIANSEFEGDFYRSTYGGAV